MNKTRNMRLTLIAFLLGLTGFISSVHAIDYNSKPNRRTLPEAVANARNAVYGPLKNATSDETSAGTAIQAIDGFTPSAYDGIGSSSSGSAWVSGNRWYSPTSGLIKLSQVDLANVGKRISTGDERKRNRILAALTNTDQEKMTTTLSEGASTNDDGLPLVLHNLSSARMKLQFGLDYAAKISAALNELRIARVAMMDVYQASTEYSDLLKSLNLTDKNILNTLQEIRKFINTSISEKPVLDYKGFDLSTLKGRKPTEKDPRTFTFGDLTALRAHVLKNNLYTATWGESNPYDQLKDSFPNLTRFTPTAKTTFAEARQYLQKRGTRPTAAALKTEQGLSPEALRDRVVTLDDAFHLLNPAADDTEDEDLTPALD